MPSLGTKLCAWPLFKSISWALQGRSSIDRPFKRGELRPKACRRQGCVQAHFAFNWIRQIKWATIMHKGKHGVKIIFNISKLKYLKLKN
jgi:hypothetical protein